MLHVCFSKAQMINLQSSASYLTTPSNFSYLEDDLSLGKLQSGYDGEAGRKSRKELLGDFCDGGVNPGENYAEFCDKIRNAEEITVWYSNSPRDTCGLLFALSLIRSDCVKVYTVNCSQIIHIGENTVRFDSLDSIAAEEIRIFLSTANKCTAPERLEAKRLWKDLVRQNGECRAFLNGTVQTVDITYYDRYLLRFAGTSPRKIAEVIGGTLNWLSRTQGISVNDGFLAMRIKKLIDNNKMIQITAETRFFENLIIKT